jgi:hypothetical protein
MRKSKSSKGRIIVSGILFWYPLAGVTYQFIHYMIGLRRLGFDVFYIEDSGRWVYDPQINQFSSNAAGNISSVAPILEVHGFKDCWAFRGRYEGGDCYGMTEQDVLRLYREADALLNVTGAQEICEEHLSIPRRIYVESDPFAAQIGVALGNQSTIAALAAHDTHFSFGENLGAEDCLIPTGGFVWLPTRQPVVVDLWTNPGFQPADAAFNTITTWHNDGKDIDYQGDRYYWTKDREFMKLLELPRKRQGPFELATQLDSQTADLLRRHDWRLVHSGEISKDIDRYREYIQQSRGEFTVARDQYVRPRTGWFSDRSVCYLAAGRPVITQETGFSKTIPTGRGLFGFNTMDEVLAAVDAVETDYEANCRAAREIAEEYFSAEKVIASLMARAGLAE